MSPPCHFTAFPIKRILHSISIESILNIKIRLTLYTPSKSHAKVYSISLFFFFYFFYSIGAIKKFRSLGNSFNVTSTFPHLKSKTLVTLMAPAVYDLTLGFDSLAIRLRYKDLKYLIPIPLYLVSRVSIYIYRL